MSSESLQAKIVFKWVILTSGLSFILLGERMLKALLLLPVIVLAVGCVDTTKKFSGVISENQFRVDSKEVAQAEESLKQVGCSFEESVLVCNSVSSETATTASLEEVNKRLEAYKVSVEVFLAKYAGKKVIVNRQAQDFPAESEMVLKKNIEQSQTMMEKVQVRSKEVADIRQIETVNVYGSKKDAEDEVKKIETVNVEAKKADAKLSDDEKRALDEIKAHAN